MTKQTEVENMIDTPEALYRATLPPAGYIVGEDGSIGRPSKEGQTPFEVNDKPVYIPTRPLLAKNKWENIQPYHPLCEDVLHGQSQLIQKLVRNLQAVTTMHLISTVNTIIEVGSSATLQKENHCTDADDILLNCGVNIGKTTLAAWTALRKKMVESPQMEMYINRDREGEDSVKYSRLGVFTYPILEAFNDKGVKVLGADLKSKANKAAIQEVFKFVIDGLPKEIGSSAVTPYFQVYLFALRAVTKRFNELNEPFTRVVPWDKIDDSWFTVIDDLSPFISRIPRLPGCSGDAPIINKPRNSGVSVGSLFDEVKIPETIREEDVAEVKVQYERETPSRDNSRQRTTERRAPSLSDFEDDYRNERPRNRRERERDEYRREESRGGRRSIMDDLDSSHRDSRSRYDREEPRGRGSDRGRNSRRGSSRDSQDRREESRSGRRGCSIHDF